MILSIEENLGPSGFPIFIKIRNKRYILIGEDKYSDLLSNIKIIDNAFLPEGVYYDRHSSSIIYKEDMERIRSENYKSENSKPYNDKPIECIYDPVVVCYTGKFFSNKKEFLKSISFHKEDAKSISKKSLIYDDIGSFLRDYNDEFKWFRFNVSSWDLLIRIIECIGDENMNDIEYISVYDDNNIIKEHVYIKNIVYFRKSQSQPAWGY